MGTRAIISKNGKVILATHWDGYPDSLGQELKSAKTMQRILVIASKHHINSAEKSIKQKANKLMLKKLKKNGQYESGYSWLEEENDQFVDDISTYGDFAEYQYDFTNNQWKYRALHGQYPTSVRNATKNWTYLTPKISKQPKSQKKLTTHKADLKRDRMIKAKTIRKRGQPTWVGDLKGKRV